MFKYHKGNIMAIKLSRHPELNLEKCVANAGGNKYELILIAAIRARELAKSHGGRKEYSSPGISALLEIQDGKVDSDMYLAKIGKQ